MGQDRVLVLLGAGLAFMAGQGFARFGLTLILPDMRAGLALSYSDLGLLAGAAFGAYFVFAAPAGAAAARFGARRVVPVSLALSASGLLLTGLAPNLEFALAAQVLNGAAGTGVIVPVLGLSPNWFGPTQWGRATGVIVAGGGVGLMTAGLLVPIALQAGGGDGWRLAWLYLGVATFIVAAASAALLRDPPGPGRRLSERPGLRAVYRSTAIWKVGLAFLCYGVAYAVYGTFFGAQLVTERGLDNSEAGRLWALSGLVSVGSGLLGGWLTDHFGRRGPLALLFLGQAVALAALGFGTDERWYATSACLYGLTVWGFPAVFTAASADAVGPELTPAAVGLTVLCFSVGQALGPPLAGALAELSGSFTPAVLLGVVADASGFMAALAIRTR
jgi:predicted MFS family arabinose efflux permease